MSRAILLDWSGTLVDDLPPVIEATNRILAHYGRPELTRDEFRESFRLPFVGFWDEQLPRVGIEELEPLYHKFFDGIQDAVEPLPHARDFLDYCVATGRRLFLLSSIKRAHFEKQSSKLGFADYFEHAYVEVWDKKAKIREVLAEHRLAAETTLFVGDMVHDIETARHGGVLSVATLTGYDPAAKLMAAAPDLTVSTLEGLLKMLKSSDCSSQNARPVATVGALLRDDDGRILMLRTHKWSHKWGIPGGKIRRGEGSVEALRREVLEETALEIANARFVMAQDSIDSQEFEHPAHFILLNYVARVSGYAPAVTLNNEAEESCWVKPSEAFRMDLNQPTRILIEEVMRHEL